MPMIAPPQITDSMMTFFGHSSASIASGVYVPAISRKMFEWSRRRKTAFVVGFQLKRWYTAETPNSRRELAMKIADAILAGPPSESTMSTMPAAIASGNVPAWIQPRHVVFAASSFSWSMASSSSGMFGRSFSSVTGCVAAAAASERGSVFRGRAACMRQEYGLRPG
jgi:hypothetical protein